MGLTPIYHSVLIVSYLNVKALIGAFNQEKALVGAFSVIVQLIVEPMDRFAALVSTEDTNTEYRGCWVLVLSMDFV